MAISIHLPPTAEDELRAAFGQNLDQVAFEALLVEGYRCGSLSSAQVGRLLGFDNRWDTENWLGQHGVTWNYSSEDLEADRRTLGCLFGDKR